MDIMELAKRIMELLNGSGLRERLEKVILDGTELGRKTAFADIKIDGRTEPDFESIVRIGMRANALSDSAIARAKGNFAREVDTLYQEMDAALKAGMKKNEALGQIEERFRGLFEDSYKDWEIERLVRDQFLVATKEGRRSGWQDGGVLWRQWTMHSDSRTGDDSKRMHGQIVRIDEPYTDPLTGKKYMIEQMRPNDRCFSSPLFTLPENLVYRKGLMYASDSMTKNADVFFVIEDFLKGGEGSGIKGHTTFREGGRKKDFLEHKEEIHEYYMETLKIEILTTEEDISMDKWFNGNLNFLDTKLTQAFGLGKESSREANTDEEYIKQNSDVDNKYIDKMYLLTQEMLKRSNVLNKDGTVTLFRGVGGRTFEKFLDHEEGSKIDLETYNASSWTRNIKNARRFMEKNKKGVLISSDVPAERIFSQPIGSLSSYSEDEYVVIGKNITGTIEEKFDISQIEDGDYDD